MSEVLESTSPEKEKKRIWSIIISILLAGLFLYLAFHGLNWQAFFQTIRSANYKFLFLTFPLGSLSYYLRARRWRVLLSAKKDLPAKKVFWANMAGYLGNAFLPARMGEMIRSYLLGREEKNFTAFVFATAITERIFDLVVLVIGAALALRFLGGTSQEIYAAVQTMAIVGVIGLILVILTPSAGEWFLRVLKLLPIPERNRCSISRLLVSFLDGMISLRSFDRIKKFLFYTVIIWTIDTLVCVIFALIFFRSLSFSQAFLLLACLGISSALPSTPGYIGIYQFVAVTVLIPFGFPQNDALAYILLLQSMGYITVTLWGLIGLWYLRRTHR